MTIARDHFVHWLAELRLLSPLLLLARLFKLYRLEQPALRIAMSIVVGLATLAVEVTAPGWPAHLLPTRAGRRRDISPSHRNVTRAGE